MVLGTLQPSFNSRKVTIKRKPGDISESVTSPGLRLAKTPTRCFISQLQKWKQIASPSLNTWLRNNSQQTAAQFTNRNVGLLVLSSGQSSLGSDGNLPALPSTGIGASPAANTCSLLFKCCQQKSCCWIWSFLHTYVMLPWVFCAL